MIVKRRPHLLSPQLLSRPVDPVLQLALSVFILGTIVALPALLLWTLRGRHLP